MMLLLAVLVPVVFWACAAAQAYALTVCRGRAGVLAGARRLRLLLIAGAVPLPLLASRTVAPLVIVPVVAVTVLTLPRLRRLIRTLKADPWGPSDPRVRRAAADPRIVAPVAAALASALATVTAAETGVLGVAVSAIVAAAGAALLTWHARHRATRLATRRVGVLRRTLVSPAPQPAERREPVAA